MKTCGLVTVYVETLMGMTLVSHEENFNNLPNCLNLANEDVFNFKFMDLFKL